MRLLHFDQAGRLLSTDFSGKIIPPYAILSHRWGDSEVLFVDIANESYEEKEGYRKIEFCAEQAAKDQLQYFWIDTCCIDKWNLNELSKSINSMFRWYKDARKCYVFLPDVSVSTVTATAQRTDWEASFRASEWFRRGWTLQELIAPESVEFFTREGQRIGDKRSLEQLIHEISDVPIEALQGCSLDKFTIPERMEWTKSRETTEEEDIVYCLLGILSISMPTSYGEGREKARIRLTAEINNSAPFIVPFSQNDNFVGQKLQLAELETKFLESNQAATVAIAGPRGIGKSQLALELAYRVRQQNKSCSVFWIDASSLDGVDQSYANVARKLKIPGWNDEKTDVKQIVKLHLSRKEAGQTFLIFDNADTVNLSSNGISVGQYGSLADYLPQSELCSILFTTTNYDVARTLASQNIIELQGMEQDTARQMLEQYLNTPVSRNEQQQAELLLQELSHLPLAIVHAAAYINTTRITLQNYRTQLAERDQADLNSISDIPENKLQGYDRKSPIAATLHLSIKHICHESPLAAEYLFLAACVNPKDILLGFLGAPSPYEKEEAIRILNCYKLVTRRPAESALDLHRFVHAALRGWLWKHEALDKWTKRAIAQISRVFPESSHGNRSKWRRMLPHAKYTLSYSSRNQEDTEEMELIRKCADALFSDGQYRESEELFKQVVETSARLFGYEHPNTLISMANLASTYSNQGRWKEAEELLVQVMETSSRVLGYEHPDTLISMGNLAATYRNQGRWKEAEELAMQVMEKRKKVLGNEHPLTLTSMANLASTYMKQGRWKKAEELEAQVMEVSLRVLGEENPSTLHSMGNLASTYMKQGRWKEAEGLDMQVIEMRKKVLGYEHPDTLTSMGNLASTYCGQGRWKEAEELFVQVMETSSRVLGYEHPDTLTSMANLASTYRNQDRLEEAGVLDVQVMEISKRVLGYEHPDTLTSMGNLALTYRNQGRWEEAESLEVQVMETRKTVMANLALTYRSQGRWKEAEGLDMQVIETRKKVLGYEHPDTLTSMGNLASTYWDQGRWKEAGELFVQVKEIRSSMANLASTYWNQGRWKEAEELDVQVIETRKRVFGVEHPDTLNTMADLALTYWNQGWWKEAEELFVQVIETRSRVLGDEHPDTLTSMANLASTYRNQGRWKETEELEVQVVEMFKKVSRPEGIDLMHTGRKIKMT
ncbi:kinesin light chain 3 [Dendryphion nanum]|uniref:Kinesin light chain 3 n=1 Tax=Dendryphion nanum TaxID=256645 RepID=A0A9P9DFC2_9PLEO|nr:kinesin light chain 3 [Dendryphion nanum]